MQLVFFAILKKTIHRQIACLIEILFHGNTDLLPTKITMLACIWSNQRNRITPLY